MATKKDVKAFIRFLKKKRAYGSYVLEANRQKYERAMFYNPKGNFRLLYSVIDDLGDVAYREIANAITQSLLWSETKSPGKWRKLFGDAWNFDGDDDPWHLF